jgi:hypothetical protein
MGCLGAALALAVACGSDESTMARDGGSGSGAGGTGAGASGSEDPGPGAAGALGGLPDEDKDLSAFRAPVVTGQHLWFVNPDSNRVALIEATNLEVQVLSGGFRPTYVGAVPADGVNSALVINTGSSDATWFRVDNGQVTSRTIALHRGANRWTVSASGRWAVAWSAEEAGVPLDPTEGLQDITIVDLKTDPPATQRLAVGYRPSALSYAAGEEALIVVAEPGISVIDLRGEVPETVRWIQLGSGTGRGVNVTPSGEFALVRRSGEPTVEILPLDGAPTATVTLDGPVTDLELDAAGSRAVAVVREQRQIAVFDVVGAYADPSQFDELTVPGELFGSVALSPDGELATLYTTAVDSGRLVLVDLRAGANYLSHRVVDVKAPVRSVRSTPDGDHAIALMAPAEDSTNPGSFALVSVRSPRFPRIEATQAPVHQVAVDSAHALVTTRDAEQGVYESYMIQMPGGSIERVRLSSPPTAVGVLAELGLGYVAQSHPEGRVSVLNFASGQVRTLTGFELASKVVE